MVPVPLQLADSTLRRVIKQLHYRLEIMLLRGRWPAEYPLSLRNLEEMRAERRRTRQERHYPQSPPSFVRKSSGAIGA
jgi:hypothetical protein